MKLIRNANNQILSIACYSFSFPCYINVSRPNIHTLRLHTHDHVILLFSSLDYAYFSDSYHELTSKLVLTLDSFNIKLALIMILCYLASLSWWKLPDSDRIVSPNRILCRYQRHYTTQCLLHMPGVVCVCVFFLLFSIFL